MKNVRVRDRRILDLTSSTTYFFAFLEGVWSCVLTVRSGDVVSGQLSLGHSFTSELHECVDMSFAAVLPIFFGC